MAIGQCMIRLKLAAYGLQSTSSEMKWSSEPKSQQDAILTGNNVNFKWQNYFGVEHWTLNVGTDAIKAKLYETNKD